MRRRQNAEEPQDQADQQALVRTLDETSDQLKAFTKATIRNNPIKIGFWVVGLMLCFLFNGSSVTENQLEDYSAALNKIPHLELDQALEKAQTSDMNFRQSKGWFWTCNTEECISNKQINDIDLKILNSIQQEAKEYQREANAAVGLFSEEGVRNTRSLFWGSYQRGKQYASDRTKMDLLFAGISAMGRDEKLANFLFRILLNAIFNITIGVMSALVSFLWNLWSLIIEYKSSLFVGCVYFIGAGLAAVSFGAGCLAIIYATAAGTIYVGAKALATTIRIENGGGRRRAHIQGNPY
jgi:hypothetical protein